jgi:RecA-family ATPase
MSDQNAPQPQTAAAPAARYQVRNAAYALQPQAPLAYLVEGLIAEGSLSCFYGEPGSKKTYALLSLAVCAAMGKPWLHFPVGAPRRVLFVDEESGERRLTLRLAEAIRGELGDGGMPLQYVCLAGFKIEDESDAFLLRLLIEESGAQLVIIDALADVMSGDENSKQETQPVMTALRRIADQTRAALIFIHHSNKMGGYRGSSAIKAAVDLMVAVSSEDGKEYINFKTEKNRDGEALRWAAKAAWVPEAGQFYLSAFENLPPPTRQRPASQQYVLRYLEEHGPSPMPEIMSHADVCSGNAARQAVYSLAEKGLIYRTNPGVSGKGVQAIYTLAGDGEDEDVS